MTVLILAAEFDVSADQMVLALRERGVPVCRLDTMWFPAQLSLDAELRDSRWRGWLRAPGRDVELEGLRSVWYRSPTTFQFPPELSGAERHHAFLEGWCMVRWTSWSARMAPTRFWNAILVVSSGGSKLAPGRRSPSLSLICSCRERTRD